VVRTFFAVVVGGWLAAGGEAPASDPVGAAAGRFPGADAWGEVRVTPDRVPAADFTVAPSGLEIVFYGYNRALYFYDVAPGRVVREVPCDYAPQDIAYSPDGKLLATPEWTHGVRLRDPKTGQVLDTLNPEAEVGPFSATFLPDGRLAAYCSRMAGSQPTAMREQLAVWDVAAKQQVGWPAAEQREENGAMIRRRFPGAGRPLLSIETKHANGYVVARSAALTDPTTNKESKVLLDMDDDFVFDVSPDGLTLLVFNLNRPPRLVDVATGETTRVLVGGHRNYVTCGAFSPDGKLVATASGTTRRTNLIPKAPAGGEPDRDHPVGGGHRPAGRRFQRRDRGPRLLPGGVRPGR
jgi:WD40 repeat protein